MFLTVKQLTADIREEGAGDSPEQHEEDVGFWSACEWSNAGEIAGPEAAHTGVYPQGSGRTAELSSCLLLPAIPKA